MDCDATGEAKSSTEEVLEVLIFGEELVESAKVDMLEGFAVKIKVLDMIRWCGYYFFSTSDLAGLYLYPRE